MLSFGQEQLELFVKWYIDVRGIWEWEMTGWWGGGGVAGVGGFLRGGETELRARGGKKNRFNKP